VQIAERQGAWQEQASPNRGFMPRNVTFTLMMLVLAPLFASLAMVLPSDAIAIAHAAGPLIS